MKTMEQCWNEVVAAMRERGDEIEPADASLFKSLYFLGAQAVCTSALAALKQGRVEDVMRGLAARRAEMIAVANVERARLRQHRERESQ